MNAEKIKEVADIADKVKKCEYVSYAETTNVDLGSGRARIRIELEDDLFYKVLGEKTGLEIGDEGGLLDAMMELSRMKKEGIIDFEKNHFILKKPGI